jgi:hypothetical protein
VNKQIVIVPHNLWRYCIIAPWWCVKELRVVKKVLLAGVALCAVIGLVHLSGNAQSVKSDEDDSTTHASDSLPSPKEQTEIMFREAQKWPDFHVEHVCQPECQTIWTASDVGYVKGNHHNRLTFIQYDGEDYKIWCGQNLTPTGSARGGILARICQWPWLDADGYQHGEV